MRNWLVFLVLAISIIVPFLIWGEWFTNLFSGEGATGLLSQYGDWAWLVGIILLIGDLFLPLPSTVIMATLGLLYGPILGGLVSSLGSFLSGMLAFGICKALGRKGALYILGEKDLAKGEQLFLDKGGWIVALSRWLPILPEIVACMAGLNQMRTRSFIIALLCGSIPLGFVFAFIGHRGVEYPIFTIIISAGLPPILWIIARSTLRRLGYGI